MIVSCFGVFFSFVFSLVEVHGADGAFACFLLVGSQAFVVYMRMNSS